MGITLIERLDARDRALFRRWATGTASTRAARSAWCAVTVLGGVWCSVLAALLPILLPGAARAAGLRASAVLALSHLIVQLVKRSVGRARPSRHHAHGDPRALVAEPDRFSLPSGHAAAAMSVAAVYAAAWPWAAAPLLVLAGAVGLSRVRVGVHYPGDVIVGQLIAGATAAAVLAW